MKKFIVEDAFWQVFPNAKIGIVICNDVDNTIKDTKKYEQLLKDASKEAQNYLIADIFSENEVVKVWREAFQNFKSKKGARCSVEALLKRVSKGDEINCINPLVDIYNAVSLKYALPCGGEDIATFVGDIRLTKAIGDEPFITLGSDKSEPPLENEIMYKDDAGAICRCWNWRESVRTMLTEQTTNAFLCIELVDLRRDAIFNEALNELANLVQDNLGGTFKIMVLDSNNREVEIAG